MRNPTDDLPSCESETCDIGGCSEPWADTVNIANGRRKLRLCEEHHDQWPSDARALSAVERVSSETGVRPEVIFGRARTTSVLNARRKLMAILWLEHGMSTNEVADALGRDHVTVIFAVRRALGRDVYQREVAARRGRAA